MTTAAVNTMYNQPKSSADSTLKGNTVVTESIPLIEEELIDPPLTNPESNDSENDRKIGKHPFPGVDEEFFFNRLNPDGPTIPGSDEGKPEDPGVGNDRNGGGDGQIPSRNPMSPTFPSGADNGSVFPDFELGTTDLESIPDINAYQHKKTLAQGMMDLALFSANANQLRYVLESDSHPYYYSGIVLITISLFIQVGIGVGLIWNSRYNVKDKKEICIANKINNFTIIGIFLVTVVNVFISAFGVASVQPIVVTPAAATG